MIGTDGREPRYVVSAGATHAQPGGWVTWCLAAGDNPSGSISSPPGALGRSSPGAIDCLHGTARRAGQEAARSSGLVGPGMMTSSAGMSVGAEREVDL